MDVGTGGYVHVGRIVGALAADRTNIGARSIPLLHSRLAQYGDYLRVTFGQSGGTNQPAPAGFRSASAGNVTAETDDLDQGEVSTTVRMRQPGVAVLSASFDPGWTAIVDGRARPTQMVAPAPVATTVPAGIHRIIFRYRGFRGYPLLFALCGLTLAGLLIAQTAGQRRELATAGAHPLDPL